MVREGRPVVHHDDAEPDGISEPGNGPSHVAAAKKEQLRAGQMDSRKIRVSTPSCSSVTTRNRFSVISRSESSRIRSSRAGSPSVPTVSPVSVSSILPASVPARPDTSVARRPIPRASWSPRIASKISCMGPVRIGSVKISTLPPQFNPSSPACFSVRMKCCSLGADRSMTSRASAQTSASRQPPPTVPVNVPSPLTSIFAFLLIGSDPLLDTMVESAAFSPRERTFTTSSKTSFMPLSPLAYQTSSTDDSSKPVSSSTHRNILISFTVSFVTERTR